MKFDFSKRAGEFGGFNNRWEKDGPEKQSKAIDLPVRFPVKAKELDMLCPTQDLTLSEFLFGDDLRKPALQCHLLSPLKVHRHPEHITLTIYDDGIDKRKKLTFTECKVKDPVIEFDQDTSAIFLDCKFQFRPDAQLQRINDNVENKTLQFECKASQPELFDKPEEADPDAQGELLEGEADDEDDDDDD